MGFAFEREFPKGDSWARGSLDILSQGNNKTKTKSILNMGRRNNNRESEDIELMTTTQQTFETDSSPTIQPISHTKFPLSYLVRLCKQSPFPRWWVLWTCIWFLALLYGERLVFKHHLQVCQKDKSSENAPIPFSLRNSLKDATPPSVAVIADPQLTDDFSYPHLNPWIRNLARLYCDVYIRKANYYLDLLVEPTYKLFLGDLLDNARIYPDEMFRYETKRFKTLFHIDNDPDQSRGKEWYVAGNHGIGFGNTIVDSAYDRFVQYYGPTSYHRVVGNVSIIVVDGISLSSEREKPQHQSALKFLEELHNDPSLKETRVLVTHVPLFRKDGSDCGPLRRSANIHQGKGFQYQNLLSQELSEKLLKEIQPALILSGDDHDICTFHHTLNASTYTEVTVGTFSWLQGNPYPNLAILSLDPFLSESSLLSHHSSSPHVIPLPPGLHISVCFLPNQYHIYFSYIALFMATLLFTTFNILLNKGSQHPALAEYEMLGFSSSSPYTLFQKCLHVILAVLKQTCWLATLPLLLYIYLNISI